jgi:hypothetical protein
MACIRKYLLLSIFKKERNSKNPNPKKLKFQIPKKVSLRPDFDIYLFEIWDLLFGI